MISYEKELADKGIKLIVGIDEAGRGSLAGPLTVGAVILDMEQVFEEFNLHDSHEKSLYLQIKDSKKVPPKKREILYEFITGNAVAWGIGLVEHYEVDAVGISEATQLGFLRALNNLNQRFEYILTDKFPINAVEKGIQSNIVKGDSLSITIAAASIVAKVFRDRLMVDVSKKYPKYGFDLHKGYGTAQHRKLIEELGPCDFHRRSFEPVKSILKFEGLIESRNR